jgi:hypothetical protein
MEGDRSRPSPEGYGDIAEDVYSPDTRQGLQLFVELFRTFTSAFVEMYRSPRS